MPMGVRMCLGQVAHLKHLFESAQQQGADMDGRCSIDVKWKRQVWRATLARLRQVSSFVSMHRTTRLERPLQRSGEIGKQTHSR